MVFWNKGFKGEARGNSLSSIALPRSGYGPQSQRVPPAWKTKKGSGPSGDGVGGGSDSRELGDVRTQPPPLSPPLRKAGPQGHPRKVPQRLGQRGPGARTRPGTGGDGPAHWGEGRGKGRSRRAKKGRAVGWGRGLGLGAGRRSGAGRSRPSPGLPETVTALTAAAAAAAVGRWGLGGARPRLLGQLELAVAGGQQEDLELRANPRPGGGGGCSWSPGSAGGRGFSEEQVSGV